VNIVALGTRAHSWRTSFLHGTVVGVTISAATRVHSVHKNGMLTHSSHGASPVYFLGLVLSIQALVIRCPVFILAEN